MFEILNNPNSITLIKFLITIVGSKEVISFVQYIFKTRKKKKQKKRETVKYSLDVQKDIEDQFLNDLRLITNADRTYVSLFHNGTASSTGLHFNKLSMRYENVRPGISKEKDNFQNIPVETYSERIIFLMENNFRIVLNTDVMDEDETKHIMLEKGVKCYFLLMVKDRKNPKIPLCTIGIDYVSIANKEMSDKQILKEMEYYAQRIAHRLTEDKKYLNHKIL
jgi:hypothetical protein